MDVKQKLHKQSQGLNVAKLTRDFELKLKRIKQLSSVTPNYWATTTTIV